MDWIVSVNNAVNAIAWGYILLACVLGGGLYLTVRTGFLQFRKFAYAMKNTIGKMFQRQKAGAGAVTPFQAVTTALAATIGTGNIVGTSQAIALGGYGAVFWMWVAALFGMVIKYSEVVLAIRYRERNAAGDWVGGPMYYITNGLGKNWKWLAGLFAAFGALAAFGIGNMSQANSIAGAVNTAAAAFHPAAAGAAGTINLAVGIILAAFAGLVLLGGLKRIGAVTEKLVPFMSVVYILCTLAVILMNVGHVGDALGKIFVGAFDPPAVLGGAFGITVSGTVTWGLKRSAFSNEAGLGSAPIAHAAAHTDSPVGQGLYGIFEVFMDTIVICTLTALTIIVSGVPVQFGVTPGAELITGAFATVFGPGLSPVFVALALVLFASSTILGWSLYGTRCFQYLFGTKPTKLYQAAFIIVIVIGATIPLSLVWDIADTLNGLMAIPNFVALFALSGVVVKLTRDYFQREKRKR